MATQLQLDIVTPERNVFSGPVSQVVIPAWDGQMGIFPNHDAILALLRGGIASVYTSGGIKTFAVGRGFAEIGPDKVTLLTDACQAKDEVDRDKARKEYDEASAVLGKTNGYSEAYQVALARYEYAKACLRV